MSMYIRIKRKKTTIFMHVEPTDTVLEVKQKLQDLVSRGPEQLRLFKDKVLLEDAKNLAALKVENDDVVALTYQNTDGSWEDIDITPFEPEKEIG